MFQVRIHGRGGQDVVSGAEILSVAAFLEGKYAQAFPSFGSERMGAPVMAFCRIVMTVGNRAIGAPINIWNGHSANWGLVSRVSRWASPSGSSPSTQFRVDPSQYIQPVRC